MGSNVGFHVVVLFFVGGGCDGVVAGVDGICDQVLW